MKNMNGERGHVMVAVMVVMFILSILGMAKLTIARHDAVETIRLEARGNAFVCAERGMNEFVAIVNDEDNRYSLQDLGLVDETGVTDVFPPQVPVYNSEGKVMGTFTVTLEPTSIQLNAWTVVNGYEVASIGRSPNGQQVRISMKLRTTTIAEQVWGSNSEGGIWFVTSDKVFGGVRSNDKFYINGKPLFTNGVAKTADSVTRYYSGGDSSWVDPDVFKGTLLYNQARIVFDPGVITAMRSLAQQTYPDGTKIVFNGDQFTATYNTFTTNTTLVKKKKKWVPVTTIETNSVSEMKNINAMGDSSSDDDNIIYVDGDVTVSGNVSAPISVVSQNAILVDASGTEGGLVYTDMKTTPDPRTWGTSVPPEEQRIGLFAVEKVMVTGTSYGQPVNLHAALYIATGETSDAVNDRGFCIEKYNVNYGSPYINFYGCMVQKLRGAVGQTSGTGFLKNYNQDKRFFKKPPPATPINDPEFYNWQVAYL